jgi:hypothetical protein
MRIHDLLTSLYFGTAVALFTIGLAAPAYATLCNPGCSGTDGKKAYCKDEQIPGTQHYECSADTSKNDCVPGGDSPAKSCSCETREGNPYHYCGCMAGN